jgi:hypothetical protein
MGKAKAKEVSAPRERFFRIVELPLGPGDTLRGYQAEMVSVEGDRIVERVLLDKPNMFEYAQTHLVDLMDPRNNVEVF